MMIIDLVRRSLSTEIAPMIYITMFVSVLVGFFFLTGFMMNNSESILYGTGVLVNRRIWGGLLLITASIALFGMIKKEEWLIQFGGIAGFMLWMFASIAVFMAGHLYVLLTITLFHLLFHGYVYLATTTGLIYRRSH